RRDQLNAGLARRGLLTSTSSAFEDLRSNKTPQDRWVLRLSFVRGGWTVLTTPANCTSRLSVGSRRLIAYHWCFDGWRACVTETRPRPSLLNETLCSSTKPSSM